MFAKAGSLLFLALVVAGCSPKAIPSVSVAATTDTALPFPSTAVPSSTAEPALVPTAASSLTPTAQPVTIAAVRGNLFIRRGPDMAFNPISALMEGQRATAVARDVLATWVQIPLPDNPNKSGWISIQTKYSAVSGDVMSLPEIFPTEWPVPASLRNCTFDQMVANPGGIVLPALNNFPANDVQMDPGIYRIYDTDVDGSPEVLKVELREGSAIDIRVDGNGHKQKCPVP